MAVLISESRREYIVLEFCVPSDQALAIAYAHKLAKYTDWLHTFAGSAPCQYFPVIFGAAGSIVRQYTFPPLLHVGFTEVEAISIVLSAQHSLLNHLSAASTSFGWWTYIDAESIQTRHVSLASEDPSPSPSIPPLFDESFPSSLHHDILSIENNASLSESHIDAAASPSPLPNDEHLELDDSPNISPSSNNTSSSPSASAREAIACADAVFLDSLDDNDIGAPGSNLSSYDPPPLRADFDFESHYEASLFGHEPF